MLEKKESIYIDYYNNFISYVRLVMKELGKLDSPENFVIKDIYNNILNKNNNDDTLITKMIILTALFENKLYSLGYKKSELIKDIYISYIKPIVYNYSNGDKELSNMLFSRMNEVVKSLVGYNVLYSNNEIEIKRRVK